MPSAEIITIGTELLLGETVDTNTRTIALALRAIGVDLYRTITIGDNVQRIAQTIQESLERADIVITTGGLGPTVDDPTRQAVAQATNLELEYRPELWDQIVERIGRYGRTPSENQKRQAYVPRGAQVISNPVGTAPAFIVKRNKKVVISLPGVPREMETLLNKSVLPYLQEHYDLHEVILVRVLHTSGLGESLIDDKIGDLEQWPNPTVGLAAHSGIVDVRITAKAETVAQAKRQIDNLEAEIRQRLGRAIFGVDNETLEGVVLRKLAERGWRLSAVESGCDGHLARRLTGPGQAPVPVEIASSLNEDLLAQAVSQNCQKHQTEVGLGVIVTPFEEYTHIVLYLHTPAGTQSRQLSYGGHPLNASRWAVNMALDWLRLEMEQA
ncbi:MAG: molybdopterin-binding protein [Candidatus Villigracilaceae bacterium]